MCGCAPQLGLTSLAYVLVIACMRKPKDEMGMDRRTTCGTAHAPGLMLRLCEVSTEACLSLPLSRTLLCAGIVKMCPFVTWLYRAVYLRRSSGAGARASL